MKNRTRIFCTKPLRIRFDKIHGFIRVYDRTRYLVLFDTEKYDSIYNRIIFSISHKSDITYVISHIMQNQNWFIWLFVSRRNIVFAWFYNIHLAEIITTIMHFYKVLILKVFLR